MSKNILTIPQSLEILAAQHDVSKNQILRLMGEFAVTTAQMTEVIECVAEYSAKPRRILELVRDHDLRVSEVWSLYEIRDSVKTKSGGVSLEQLALLKDAFPDAVDLDNSEQVHDLLIEICEFYGHRGDLYMGTHLSLFLEQASKHDAVDPRHLLEILIDMAEYV